MNRVAVHISPVDRFIRRSSPLPPISGEDSPSRNPCKVRAPSAGGLVSYRNEPYAFRVFPKTPSGSPNGSTATAREMPFMPAIPMSALAAPPAADAMVAAGCAPLPLQEGATHARRPSAAVACHRAVLPPLPACSVAEAAAEILPTFQQSLPSPAAPVAPHAVLASPVVPAPPSTARRGDKASVAAPRRRTLAVVRFKHNEGVFVLPRHDPATEPFLDGDYVVVEGDRGEHTGRIAQFGLQHKHNVGNIGTVLRHATQAEIDLLRVVRLQEERLVAECQEAANHCEVDMRVVDVELQSDGNKLSIFYATSSGGPVDFRQLQRYLFRQYRCRIWFVNWDDSF